MLKILQNGARIEYTKGDTFDMQISPADGEVFPDGANLDFIVADESSKTVVIQNTYDVADGVFNITFSSRDREIEYGKYIYKMVLKTVDGVIITQKSGNFEVKWGA